MGNGLTLKQKREVLKLMCNCCNSNISIVDSSVYEVLSTDTIVHVEYTNTGAVTVTLPLADVDGKRILIKDADGNAVVNGITIESQPTETIDGAGSVVISTSYGYVELYSYNNNWYIIANF